MPRRSSRSRPFYIAKRGQHPGATSKKIVRVRRTYLERDSQVVETAKVMWRSSVKVFWGCCIAQLWLGYLVRVAFHNELCLIYGLAAVVTHWNIDVGKALLEVMRNIPCVLHMRVLCAPYARPLNCWHFGGHYKSLPWSHVKGRSMALCMLGYIGGAWDTLCQQWSQSYLLIVT